MRIGLPASTWAASEHYHPTRSWYRMCLAYTHDCFGVGALYGRAITAYYNTNHRHTSWPPPKAVPVWWAGGRDGHVAFSLGDGTCWSNDYYRVGKIDRVGIHTISAGWGYHYLGWSEDINEVRVYTPHWPTIDISNVIHATRYGGDVRNGLLLKKAIVSEVGRGNMGLGSDYLGHHFRNRYRLLQRKWYGTGDGIPGPVSLTRLCKAHNLDPNP